jgi:hypothetical protein
VRLVVFFIFSSVSLFFSSCLLPWIGRNGSL